MPSPNRWEISRIKLCDMRPADNNPRHIGEKEYAALSRSLTRFGYVEPIVWNKRTGNIVGGHQRYRWLVEQGETEADVLVVDFDEKDELAANLTLNNPAIEGEWDEPLSDLLQQVEDQDLDMFMDLGMEELRQAVSPKPKNPSSGDKDSPDTTCPCCGYSWRIQAKDVKVEKS